jgi:flagellar hook-associated protein 2
MTTSSTSNTALTSLLSGLTNNTTTGPNGSSSGPLITTGQINVSQLVSELMIIQSQPLTQIQQQEAGVKSTLSAYGQEQGALSSLQSAAAALALPSAFQAAAATVTGGGVTAAITGSPVNANYALAVTTLAQTQTVASAKVASATTPLVDAGGNAANGTITITQGTNAITVNVDATDNTLNGMAAAINSAAGGVVNASVVTYADGTNQLVLSSAKTGSANGFTFSATDTPDVTGTTGTALAGLSGAMVKTQLPLDAAFSVNGVQLTSASNTVTTAISGIALTLNQAGTTAQIQVATDPAAVTKSVNGLITAYNSLVTLTNTLTNYDANSRTASVLTGDSATRSITGMLQSIFGSQWSTTGSGPSYLAQVGVSFNTDGTMALNATKFQAALNANPGAVASMFTTATGSGSQQGFAVQISNAAQQLLGTSGALGSAQQNLQTQVTYMDGQQALMQAQLAQTQAALTQQYSALNAEISAGQAQQASLANELAALPG